MGLNKKLAKLIAQIMDLKKQIKKGRLKKSGI